MRDEKQYDCLKFKKQASVEELQREIEKLQADVRRLEARMAVSPGTDKVRYISEVDLGDAPHMATDKSKECKNCIYMRLPHKSNAHYTCQARHETVEPAWTCDRYCSKKQSRSLNAVSCQGN